VEEPTVHNSLTNHHFRRQAGSMPLGCSLAYRWSSLVFLEWLGPCKSRSCLTYSRDLKFQRVGGNPYTLKRQRTLQSLILACILRSSLTLQSRPEVPARRGNTLYFEASANPAVSDPSVAARVEPHLPLLRSRGR